MSLMPITWLAPNDVEICLSRCGENKGLYRVQRHISHLMVDEIDKVYRFASEDEDGFLPYDKDFSLAHFSSKEEAAAKASEVLRR